MGEFLTPIQAAGAVLVIGASALAVFAGKKIRFGRGQIYTSIAALAFGIGFTNDAFILSTGVDTPSYLALAFIAPGTLIALTHPGAASRIKETLNITGLKTMVTLCVLNALGAAAIFQAYQISNNAARIASINQTQTILVVLAGIFLLGEKERTPQKIIASVLGFIGALFLISNQF
ncbi:MAG: EamA family transporter [Candidatus Colwellbacteria bacterium]|nr:EamA family transporter [Candidatus Colwellbacteria bacterium]